MPKVSIVIPTYNHAPMLKLALESVRAQTETDWEAIVVNNFSEDDTVGVIESFNDSRIRRVDFRNEGVIAASRNEGIRCATADWVAFLDSDDIWTADKLARCLGAANSDTEVVSHPEIIVTDGVVTGTTRTASASKVTPRALLFDGNCLSPSAILVKRAVLEEAEGFDEDTDLVTAEDFDLWLRLAERGTRFAFVDAALGQYTLHAANNSGSIERHLAASLTVIDRHALQLRPRRIFDGIRLRRARARAIYGAGRSCQRLGQPTLARRFLLQSLAAFPLQPKALVALTQLTVYRH